VNICLTQEEKTLVLAHYRQSKSSLITQRAHAVLLFNEGLTAYEVSRFLFRTEKTVREYGKRFIERRISSLFPQYLRNQHAAKLTKEQKQQVMAVLSNPPSAYGLPESFWSVKPLKSYIHAAFGVEYRSSESYRLLFQMSNFSFHLPEPFDVKRDEVLIEKRIKEIRREISPYLASPEWVVLVSDETRIVWETLIRRAWLPKGTRTIIKTTRKKQAQSFIGFLNLNTHTPHLYPISWQNQSSIIPILRKMKRIYAQKNICLVWDNARWHHGKLLKAQLGKNKPLSSLHLVNFPPYAPDTNPQEKIWKFGKQHIANRVYPTLKAVADDFHHIIMGQKFPYQITPFVLG
jgi:transposase